MRTYKPRETVIKRHIKKVYDKVFEEHQPSVRVNIRTRFNNENGCPTWAFCSKYPSGGVAISVLSEYPSKKMFEEILTHEIVHVWQFQHKTRDHHGKSFWMWDDKIKQEFGYGLKKSYDEQDY